MAEEKFSLFCTLKKYNCIVKTYNMNTLSQLISSNVRAEIFRLLFGINAVEMHMRDLERGAGCTISSIQSEMRKLSALQLVVSRRSGNRLYYSANREHPLFPEIHSIVLKTSGLCDFLKQQLMSCEDIQAAFVFGSVAAGKETATSDIDIMVIGSIGLRRLSGLLADFRSRVGRDVNPHMFTRGEYLKRKNEGEHFISAVSSASKLFVKGTENDLA